MKFRVVSPLEEPSLNPNMSHLCMMTPDELWQHQEAVLLLKFALDTLSLVGCSIDRPELPLAIRLVTRAYAQEQKIVAAHRNGSTDDTE